MTVNGTFVEYSNKFRKLTVVSATGTNAPSAGETAYGLEVPGFAFFLKPIGGDAEPIVMVKSGSCPTSDFVANWIIAKYQDSLEAPKVDQDALGKATFSISGKSAAIEQRRFDNGAVIPGSSSITLTSCSGGAQKFDDGQGGEGTMFLTDNGGALVRPESGIIFAAPQLSADVTASDWNGSYTGLVFSASSMDKVFPAKVTLNGTSGSGVQISDVENDTLESSGATFASLTAISGSKGLFNGTVDAGSGAQPISCVFSSVEGNDLLACNGADGAPSGGVYPSFFFLGVKR